MRFRKRSQKIFALSSLLWTLSLSACPGYHLPWGKDAEISTTSTATQQKSAQGLAVKCAELLIAFHQNVLSPVDGPRSHFRPSSSTYMLDAIHKYGFLKGYIMGCDRLLRENGDDWCYRKIENDGVLFKSNPVP
jgi:uncharacterized protein